MYDPGAHCAEVDPAGQNVPTSHKKTELVVGHQLPEGQGKDKLEPGGQ